MPYVIGGDCIDVNDRTCVDVCPVDAIYVGERKSYINAAECIDCGACEPECPVDAIFVQWKGRDDEDKARFVEDTETFFGTTLPGRDAPLGNPGGARKVGDLGVDTPFVAGH